MKRVNGISDCNYERNAINNASMISFCPFCHEKARRVGSIFLHFQSWKDFQLRFVHLHWSTVPLSLIDSYFVFYSKHWYSEKEQTKTLMIHPQNHENFVTLLSLHRNLPCFPSPETSFLSCWVINRYHICHSSPSDAGLCQAGKRMKHSVMMRISCL